MQPFVFVLVVEAKQGTGYLAYWVFACLFLYLFTTIPVTMYKFLLLFGLALMLSCNRERIKGNGPIQSDERKVNSFTKVSVSGATNVFVTKGSDYKVEVKGSENLLQDFTTEVVNNSLELHFKPGAIINTGKLEVYVTMPQLAGLSSSGSGGIDVKGAFASPRLDAFITGSGTIRIEGGTAESFVESIIGSGKVFAFGLLANNADITVSGSSVSEVSVARQLTAKISGSAVVYYKGNPTIQSIVSGGGKLLRRD